MAWEEIYGQDLAKRIWRSHLAAHRVCSAYLLDGPEGVGKRLLAREMAKALNCLAHDTQPCDACSSCAQITKQLHPDVHWLHPEGTAGLIKIDAVRRVLGRIALRPFSGRYQVVVVDGAERLTEEAANSLLKSLEEPPVHARFLLLTSQRAGCLPTIVSRCQVIRCQHLTTDAVETILRSAQRCDPARVGVIAHLADGSAARALELLDRWPAYERLLEQLGSDDWSSWLELELPATRDAVQQLLDGMTAWLRDVAVVSVGPPAWIAHRTAEEPLRRVAERVDLHRCLETAFELMTLRDSLDQFVSPRLVAAVAREAWLDLRLGSDPRG